MGVLLRLSEECDQAIASGVIDQINECINRCKEGISKYHDVGVAKTICYFLANLFSEKSRLLNENCDTGWRNHNMPVNLVSSLNYYRISGDLLPENRVNLGNTLNSFGRFFEALSFWDFSLSQDVSEATFVSAYAKGKQLLYHSNYLNDEGHVTIFQFVAYQNLKWFRDHLIVLDYEQLKTTFNDDDNVQSFLKFGDDSFSDMRSLDDMAKEPEYGETEKEYRSWCKENRLFLNPLNDISKAWPVDHDILQFPNYSAVVGSSQPYHAECFSSMKRDFCFARHLLYEGINNKYCEYEEKGLYLVQAECSNYSGTTEKIKTALRISFSIFDSLERLMQFYFTPDKAGKEAKFNGRQIRERYAQIKNPFIGALYWVACDLTDDEEAKGDWLAPEPSSKDIRRVRNAIEHGWLRVSDIFEERLTDEDFAMMISRNKLDAMAMRVLRLSRAAMMYFALAVKYQEMQKQKSIVSFESFEAPMWQPDY